MRSFSKISTPSKPAPATASSLSSSIPDRHTVAMARRMPRWCPSGVDISGSSIAPHRAPTVITTISPAQGEVKPFATEWEVPGVS